MAATMTREKVSFEVKIGTLKGWSTAPLPVFVQVELRPQDWGTELGMSGHIGAQSFGQIQDSIAKGLTDGDFTPYIPTETIAVMLATWERWHLNGMQAGCAHQRAMGWTLNPDKGPFWRALGPARNPENFAEVALPTRPHGEHSAAHIILPGHIFTTTRNAQGHPEYRKRRTANTGRMIIEYGDEIGTWDLGLHGPILHKIKEERKYSPGNRTANYTDGGLLGRPCPACGYGFGTAWKHEELPADVIATVKGWAGLKPAAPRQKKGAPPIEAEAEGLDAFAARVGLTVRFDRDATKDTAHAIGYRYTLSRTGSAESLTGPFTNGRGNQQPPALRSLLECLSTDADVARDCPTWKDYQDNFGDNSHEAHEGWRLGKAQTVKLRKLIGPREVERLASAVEAG